QVDDHLWVGEQADQQAAEQAGEAVRVHDAQGVVDLVERPDLPRQVAEQGPDHGRGEYADDDRPDAVHVTRGRGDADQAADHAVDTAKEGGLLLLAEAHVHDDPGHHRAGRGEVGVDHGSGGVCPGKVRV